jgi:hypothetical protein
VVYLLVVGDGGGGVVEFAGDVAEPIEPEEEVTLRVEIIGDGGLLPGQRHRLCRVPPS